jgi:hypothetical protein
MPAAEIKNTPPVKMRGRLLAASAEVAKKDRLHERIDQALAQPDDDALDAYLRETFGAGVTPRMRHLDPEERSNAIQARVETLARPEMLQFEQMVLIDTFDQAWKDHLYSMDQLRDTIGFRAIAQTDPKIEYKREGQRMFKGALREIRERVTDVIFKARLSPPPPPQGGPRGVGPGMARPAAPAGAPNGVPNGVPMRASASGVPGAAPVGADQTPGVSPGAGNVMGSTISGPGFSFGPRPKPPVAAPGTEPPSSSAQGPPTTA